MNIIHTLLFMVRKDYLEEDLIMAGRCFETLSLSEENKVVIYNQGCLNTEQLKLFLDSYNLDYHIIGNGNNIGIPEARQKSFEFIWVNYPELPYISEIHLDMLFPQDWYSPLIKYLEENREPMISPGILTKSGDVFPNRSSKYILPDNIDDILKLLIKLKKDEIIKGFVHPVIHKSCILKDLGGYDLRFLKGKQAYEDDSLLLGYLYYMGTGSGWFPKVSLSSIVYHAYMGQRMTLDNIQLEHKLNLDGLYRQYGAYGIKHLSELHILDPKIQFEQIFKTILGE